jgi:hypothetical protein
MKKKRKQSRVPFKLNLPKSEMNVHITNWINNMGMTSVDGDLDNVMIIGKFARHNGRTCYYVSKNVAARFSLAVPNNILYDIAKPNSKKLLELMSNNTVHLQFEGWTDRKDTMLFVIPKKQKKVKRHGKKTRNSKKSNKR